MKTVLAILIAALLAPVAICQTIEYPRLGGMLIGNPHNYDQSSYQHQIAKLDLAILGIYPGWNPNGTTPTQAVNAIKALNPNIILGNYTIMTQVPSTNDPATAYLRAKLNSEKGPNGVGDWWAYTSKGKHLSEQTGTWDTNLTLFVTPDANGNHWPEWLAKSDYPTLLQNAAFDIWYSDNNYWKPRVSADWNRDGTNDSYDNITVRNWWRNGQRAYYDTAKATAPGLLLMVNADSDLNGAVYPPGADVYTQYQNVASGAYMEHTMGKSWSAESWAGWATVMGWYRQLKTNLQAPQMIIFDAFLPNISDYQYFRYAFASCTMDDGYFSGSTDYNQIVWFDEYDLAGTASTKWLGAAVDGPQTAPWLNGVYRRRFANGVVLVNPKGNGPQTVTLGPGYKHFQGNQAPSVNNGQLVTTVTLQDRDGLFLVTSN